LSVNKAQHQMSRRRWIGKNAAGDGRDAIYDTRHLPGGP